MLFPYSVPELFPTLSYLLECNPAIYGIQQSHINIPRPVVFTCLSSSRQTTIKLWVRIAFVLLEQYVLNIRLKYSRESYNFEISKTMALDQVFSRLAASNLKLMINKILLWGILSAWFTYMEFLNTVLRVIIQK